MNWSEHSPEEEMLKAEVTEQESGQALYQGDSGELSLDARRVLAQLLAGPSLDGSGIPGCGRYWFAMSGDQ